jgi:hypothetical protein
VDYFRAHWHPDDLARDLAKQDAAIQAAVFVGKLEQAPESWAYILYTHNAFIADCAKDPVFKTRLTKSLVIEPNMIAAPRVAEEHGALGAIEAVGPSSGTKESYIVVKQDVGATLGWALSPVQRTASYARTGKTGLTLPALIVGYLRAALP